MSETLRIQPAGLKLVGTAGYPFALTVRATLTDADLVAIDPFELAAPAVLMLDSAGRTITAGTPSSSVTVDGTEAVVSIVWSAAQTAAAVAAGVGRWQLNATVQGDGPFPLCAETVAFKSPGTPGAATSSSADLSVVVNGATVALAVTVGGTGGEGGGGGTTMVVQVDDVTVSSAATTLDFGNGLDVTESPAGEVNVVVDLGEYVGVDLPVSGGGTGASTAAGARDNLEVLSEAEADSRYAPLGDGAAAVATHAALPDPHPGYLTPAEGNAAYDAAGSASTVNAALSAHLADTDDAHDASAISYAGGTGISATTVEGALDELATEKLDAATAATTYLPITRTVNAVGATGATETIPAGTTAQVHRLTLDAACTLTFPTATAGAQFTLELVQDATGSRLVTWPASVRWAGAVAPTLTTTAAGRDVFSFLCTDGSTWIGATVGLAFAT